MILLIDNYDSFTYNLYQYIGIFNSDIKVVRNDKITIEEIKAMDPERIVLSPGPKNPKEAGICMDVVKEFTEEKPILGICLGHQCTDRKCDSWIFPSGICRSADRTYRWFVECTWHVSCRFWLYPSRWLPDAPAHSLR